MLFSLGILNLSESTAAYIDMDNLEGKNSEKG